MKLPKNLSLLPGTHFTSTTEQLGWRHFRVLQVERGDAGFIAELVAACDETKRLRISTKQLLDQQLWLRGLVRLKSQESGVSTGDGKM